MTTCPYFDNLSSTFLMQWPSVPLHNVGTAYWRISMRPWTPQYKTDLSFSGFDRCSFISAKLFPVLGLWHHSCGVTRAANHWLSL